MATLAPSESTTSIPVQVEVLSVQGCCLRGSDLPEPGKKCLLSMNWKNREIRAEGQVAWKNSLGLAGLKFHNIDEPSREVLRDLCATLRLQPLTPWSAQEKEM